MPPRDMPAVVSICAASARAACTILSMSAWPGTGRGRVAAVGARGAVSPSSLGGQESGMAVA